ncbi:MAG: response regulator [Methylomonas sp.]
MKVLIVEDSRAIRERLLGMLVDVVDKQSLIQAGTIREARALLDIHQPDILVLDLLLPDGHGLELLRILNQSQRSPQVLIMTNDPNEQYKKRALQLGAGYFFDKARDFDRIPDVISDLMRH